MATANNLHRTAAVMRALDLDSRMPPNARLWLALASMKTDQKGRTTYSADTYANHTNDTPANGHTAIGWLTNQGIILNDTDDDGNDCRRLTHHNWDRDTDTIGGYSRDAGQRRDRLPPQYGRTVNDILEPPTGNQNYTPPTWADIQQRIRPA